MSEVTTEEVSFKGFDLKVEYEYIPGQRAITWLAPEDCQPEEPDELYVIKIENEEGDITDCFSDSFKEELERYILENK